MLQRGRLSAWSGAYRLEKEHPSGRGHPGGTKEGYEDLAEQAA